MPQAAIQNLQGEEVGQVELDATLFDVEPNRDLIHQALLYVDNQRAQLRGITQTRAEVNRTGAKVYRQKGLGRARHGDRGAPTYVGGARAHAPKGERRRHVMPKKMRRLATAGVLTAQYRKGLMRFVADMHLERANTKLMAEVLENLRCSRGRILAVVSKDEYYSEALDKSCRNLPRFILRCAPHFNVRDLLVADHIIMSQSALAELKSRGEA